MKAAASAVPFAITDGSTSGFIGRHVAAIRDFPPDGLWFRGIIMCITH
jgi:hypothetical protein